MVRVLALLCFPQNVLVTTRSRVSQGYASSVGRTSVSLSHGMLASMHERLGFQKRRNFSKGMAAGGA